MSDIRVAFVMATWHDDLVDRTKLGFFERMAELGHGEDTIDVHKLPGALEFPLHCKKLAQTGKYDVIVTAALVVDGGIYEHRFRDPATIRRMLVGLGRVARERDGSSYTRVEMPVPAEAAELIRHVRSRRPERQMSRETDLSQMLRRR